MCRIKSDQSAQVTVLSWCASLGEMAKVESSEAPGCEMSLIVKGMCAARKCSFRRIYKREIQRMEDMCQIFPLRVTEASSFALSIGNCGEHIW